MSRLFLLLLLLPLSAMAGTCLDGKTWTLAGENLVVEIVGPKATIYPPLPGGRPDRGAFSLAIDLTVVVERVRGDTFGNPDPSTNEICWTPLSTWRDPDATPLSEYYRNGKCGDVVKYVNLTDYNCDAISYIAKPAPGLEVSTVKLSMTHPGDPFVYLAIFEVPNVNATKATWNDTTHTNGSLYSTFYKYVSTLKERARRLLKSVQDPPFYPAISGL